MAKPKELPVRRVTPQKVQEVLQNSGHRCWTLSWCGEQPVYAISNYENAIYINVWCLGFYDYPERSRFLKSYATALAAAGIAAEVRDGSVWVPVDQEQGSQS